MVRKYRTWKRFNLSEPCRRPTQMLPRYARRFDPATYRPKSHEHPRSAASVTAVRINKTIAVQVSKVRRLNFVFIFESLKSDAGHLDNKNPVFPHE